MYIRRTLSCCICHVFHSVFSLYVHLMYISLSLFFVDGFYCVVLLDIVLICCCTPDNDVDSPSPDMGLTKFVPSNNSGGEQKPACGNGGKKSSTEKAKSPMNKHCYVCGK